MVDVLANVGNPVISVYWKRLLRPPGDSFYRRECPFCVQGLLLVGRDRETMVLEEYDACLYCGQHVSYLDIETMREREGRKAIE